MTRREILHAAAAIGLVARTCAASERGEREFARRIFSRINQLREQNAAGRLEWSDPLAECASLQSIRKVELRFPGHDDPERGGIAERLNAAGIGWTRCGENIFMENGWDDPVDYAVVSWWHSEAHRANLLNSQFTETGVGVARGLDQAWFVTQIFLTPPPKVRRR